MGLFTVLSLSLSVFQKKILQCRQTLRNAWAWMGLDAVRGGQVSCMDVTVGKPSTIEIWHAWATWSLWSIVALI